MTHDEIREILPLFALDSLDESESRIVAEHVAGCAECAAEVASLRAAAASLTLAVAPVAPSAGLRDRVLAAAAASPVERAPSRRRDAGTRPPSAPRRSIVSRVAALAAVVALAVLGWSDLKLRREREQLERELLVARTRAETAERDLADARAKADFALAALVRERAAASLLSDPKTTNVSMAGTPQAPGARARIAVQADAQQAVLFCAGMPQPPAGKAYQLWFIDGGEKVPGGTFAPAPDGTCLFPDRIPPEGRAAKVFAVTLEPASGVRVPTGEIFLVGTAS